MRHVVITTLDKFGLFLGVMGEESQDWGMWFIMKMYWDRKIYFEIQIKS